MPKWSMSDVHTISQVNRICYYDKEDNVDEVKRVLFRRQPLNIEMTTAEKYYDNQKHRDYLERVLKYAYDDSGYIELFKNNPNKLPPNLAVFSKSLCSTFYS